MQARQIKVFIKKQLGLIRRQFTYFNTTVFIPKNSLIFKMACEEGIYDKEVLDFILAYLKRDSLFIDVGTNIGLVSIPVLKNLPNCEVISYEPSKSVLPSLLKTHNNSIYTDRWSINSCALGDYTGEVLFKLNKKIDPAFDGITTDTTFLETEAAYDKVKITTLDKCVDILPNKYSTVVIKIDVEGFEINVLKGARQFIEIHKPFIVFEIVKDYLDRYEVSMDELLQLTNQLNYNLYGLSTLNKIITNHELQIALKKNLNFILLPNN